MHSVMYVRWNSRQCHIGSYLYPFLIPVLKEINAGFPFLEGTTSNKDLELYKLTQVYNKYVYLIKELKTCAKLRGNIKKNEKRY